MAELKILDADSLGKMVEILTKNGYKISTYVIWKNGKAGEIDYFTVQIGGLEDGRRKSNLGIDQKPMQKPC